MPRQPRDRQRSVSPNIRDAADRGSLGSRSAPRDRVNADKPQVQGGGLGIKVSREYSNAFPGITNKESIEVGFDDLFKKNRLSGSIDPQNKGAKLDIALGNKKIGGNLGIGIDFRDGWIPNIAIDFGIKIAGVGGNLGVNSRGGGKIGLGVGIGSIDIASDKQGNKTTTFCVGVPGIEICNEYSRTPKDPQPVPTSPRPVKLKPITFKPVRPKNPKLPIAKKRTKQSPKPQKPSPKTRPVPTPKPKPIKLKKSVPVPVPKPISIPKPKTPPKLIPPKRPTPPPKPMPVPKPARPSPWPRTIPIPTPPPEPSNNPTKNCESFQWAYVLGTSAKYWYTGANANIWQIDRAIALTNECSREIHDGGNGGNKNTLTDARERGEGYCPPGSGRNLVTNTFSREVVTYGEPLLVKLTSNSPNFPWIDAYGAPEGSDIRKLCRIKTKQTMTVFYPDTISLIFDPDYPCSFYSNEQWWWRNATWSSNYVVQTIEYLEFPPCPTPTPTPTPTSPKFNPPRLPGSPTKIKPMADCCDKIDDLYKYLGIAKIKKNKFKVAKAFMVPGGEGNEECEDYYEISKALIRMLANGLIINPISKPLGTEWKSVNATAWAGQVYEMTAEAMSNGNSSQKYEISMMMQITQLLSIIAEQSRKIEFLSEALGIEPDLETEEVPACFTIYEGHKGFGKKEPKKIDIGKAKTDNEVEAVIGKMLQPSKIPITKWVLKPESKSIIEILLDQ